MGWGTTDILPYVLQEYDPAQRKRCRKLIQEADVVIWGSCPYGLILPRLLAHKLTFCYSERIFKEGLSGFGYWGRAIKYGLLYRPPQKITICWPAAPMRPLTMHGCTSSGAKRCAGAISPRPLGMICPS